MTCNCIERIIEALRDEATCWKGAGDPNKAIVLAHLAARLAPPPATDWREKCKIHRASDGTYYIYGPREIEDRYCEDGKWHDADDTTLMYFPTESAARAALAAATEPGKVEADRKWLRDAAAAEDALTPSPAPAVAFDAEKWAENMVPTGPKVGGCDAQGTIRAHDFPDARHSWNPFGVWPDYDRRYIASALRAAESAGYARAKAEQEARLEVIDGERKALAKMVSAIIDITRPIHEQLGASAAPDAAKEGT